jgi:hypothetical protein
MPGALDYLEVETHSPCIGAKIICLSSVVIESNEPEDDNSCATVAIQYVANSLEIGEHIFQFAPDVVHLISCLSNSAHGNDQMIHPRYYNLLEIVDMP